MLITRNTPSTCHGRDEGKSRQVEGQQKLTESIKGISGVDLLHHKIHLQENPTENIFKREQIPLSNEPSTDHGPNEPIRFRAKSRSQVVLATFWLEENNIG